MCFILCLFLDVLVMFRLLNVNMFNVVSIRICLLWINNNQIFLKFLIHIVCDDYELSEIFEHINMNDSF